MTPPDTSPVDVILKDSAMTAGIGAAAMGVRILLSEKKMSIGWIIRHLISAYFISSFVGLVAQDYIATKGAFYGAIGVSGVMAPELVDFVIRFVKIKIFKRYEQD